METLTREQDGGDGVLFLSSFFKLLPLVLEAGAGEEETDCDAGALGYGFLVSLFFPYLALFSPCLALCFSSSFSLFDSPFVFQFFFRSQSLRLSVLPSSPLP